MSPLLYKGSEILVFRLQALDEAEHCCLVSQLDHLKLQMMFKNVILSLCTRFDF